MAVVSLVNVYHLGFIGVLDNFDYPYSLKPQIIEWSIRLTWFESVQIKQYMVQINAKIWACDTRLRLQVQTRKIAQPKQPRRMTRKVARLSKQGLMKTHKLQILKKTEENYVAPCIIWFGFCPCSCASACLVELFPLFSYLLGL